MARIKLPKGVQSFAELVRRYLVADENLETGEIVRRLSREHGIRFDRVSTAVSQSRAKYFESVGKTAQRSHQCRPSEAPSTNGSVANGWPVENLRNFLAAVRSVGGIRTAREILNLIGETNNE